MDLSGHNVEVVLVGHRLDNLRGEAKSGTFARYSLRAPERQMRGRSRRIFRAWLRPVGLIETLCSWFKPHREAGVHSINRVSHQGWKPTEQNA